MKLSRFTLVTALLSVTALAEPAKSPTAAEARQAIERGLAWLQSHQNADGSWSNSEQPALTALPVTAYMRQPWLAASAERPAYLQKAMAFLRTMVKPDGSIYDSGLSNYNTSVCLVGFLAYNEPKDEPTILNARNFIAGLQASGMADESFDGGIGYGPTAVSVKRKTPDLDNMLIALEALRAYKDARPATEPTKVKDLNWEAAIQFITRCQNLPGKNPKSSADPADTGGFVYYPGYSNAAPDDGSAPLRSYGTMSYAGFLSFVYAELKKDDPRVVAALDWLKKNYTVDQNPNMGPAGLYYYLHLMSKGLTAAGVKEIETADGRKIDWARDAAAKIIQLQTADGSWINDKSARWMEKDPVLVTSYCILSLELLSPKL